MSEMRVLGKGGDLRISWNSENEREVAVAKETFEKWVRDGWSAFRDKLGVKGDKIKTFDPDAERIVLIPPVAGG